MTVNSSLGPIAGVRRLFDGGTVAGQSERALLDRFVVGRDPVAFDAIVARHGPMVLGVCRAVLVDPTDADDAFQATFLLLVRKAGTLRDRDGLSPWLHGVARRVALRARANAAKRRGREASSPDLAATVADPSSRSAEDRELAALLHAEVDRLSPPERSAILLCDLQGMSHQEAADHLGWPLGTVKSRVARGRDRLRSRLVRRGVALSSSALAAALASEATAALVARPVFALTARAALAVVAGRTLAVGLVSPPVYALTQGAARTMIVAKLKLFAVGLVATTAALAVPGVVAYQTRATGTGVTRAGTDASPRRVEATVSSDLAPTSTTEATPASTAVTTVNPPSEPAQGPDRGGDASDSEANLVRQLDGPDLLKKAMMTLLAARQEPNFMNLTGFLTTFSRKDFGLKSDRAGIRSVYSPEAADFAAKTRVDIDSLLNADDKVTLRQALGQAAKTVGLKFRIIADDLYFDTITPSKLPVSDLPAVNPSDPAVPPSDRISRRPLAQIVSTPPANGVDLPAVPSSAGLPLGEIPTNRTPATADAPAVLAPSFQTSNIAILQKLEEPNPLRRVLARFIGGSPTGNLQPPSFPEIMTFVTEATVDPAAGLPEGIPIRLTALGKRLAPSTSISSVATLVAGDDRTPLRVVLANEAAKYGLGYRVVDRALVFDGSPGLEPTVRIEKPDVRQRNAEDDQRNDDIRAKLDRIIPLKFPNKVSLVDLLAYIKTATKEGNEKPIPIYVDPRVADNEQGLTTKPTIAIDLDDVPLRTSLRLAVIQLDLEYAVSGGLLIIGSKPVQNNGMGGGGMGGGMPQPTGGIRDLVEPRDRSNMGMMGGMGGMM